MQKWGFHKCIVCEELFHKKSERHNICSEECRIVRYGRQGRLPIATASVGAISEMAVGAYFLKQGYSVFQTMSAASFCDIVVLKGEEVMKIEVRTGYRSSTENLLFPKKIHAQIGVPTHYGVYIHSTDEIFIIPITEEDIKKYSKKYEGEEVAIT